MQSAVEVELELVVERVQLDNQAQSAALPVVRNNISVHTFLSSKLRSSMTVTTTLQTRCRTRANRQPSTQRSITRSTQSQTTNLF